MKKLFTCAVAFVLLCGCVSNKETLTTDFEYGASMRNVYEKTFSNAQFDSICESDNLSKNLSKDWHIMGLRDPETKERITQFLYIQAVGNNEAIYRVERISKDSLKVTKRIIK